MTSATQTDSSESAFESGNAYSALEPDGVATKDPARRSSFSRFGLETRDIPIVALGFLLIVAYGPFFWATNWTPRVLLLLLAVPFGLHELVRLAWRSDGAATLALVLAGWAVLTSSISDAPLVSLLPTFGRDESAWVMVAAVGCWALARGLSAAGRHAFGVGLMAACALNGLVGVCQVVFEIENGPLGAIGRRATGLSTNPVYFGATMAGGVAWCAWWAGSRRDSRLATLAALGTGCGSFFITLSGSRVAFASQLVFVIAALVKYRQTRISWLLVPAIAVGAVFGTAVQRAVGGAGSSATDRLGSGGFSARWDIWNYGWQAFLDRPLTGYGLGRFRPAVQPFFDAEFVSMNQRDDLLDAWFESHNMVVQMVVAVGVVGIALLVAFVAVSIRQSRGPLVWAAGAIALTWLLQPAHLVTFPLVALLLGAGMAGRPETVAEGRRSARRAAAATGLIVSVLLAGWVVIADLSVRAATSNPSIAASGRAVRWAPWDPLVANEAATLVFDPNGSDPRVAAQVLAWNAKAAELEPDFPYWWMRLGLRQMVFGDDDGARRSFERALDLQPYHPVSLQMLRVIATEQGDDNLLRIVDDRLQELGQATDAGSNLET